MGFVILLLILTPSVILNFVECAPVCLFFLFVSFFLCLFKFLSELLDQFLSCCIIGQFMKIFCYVLNVF